MIQHFHTWIINFQGDAKKQENHMFTCQPLKKFAVLLLGNLTKWLSDICLNVVIIHLSALKEEQNWPHQHHPVQMWPTPDLLSNLL